MRLAWSGALLACALAACTTGSTPRSDSGTRPDTGTDAASRDAGAMRCTADPDCDDGFECTIDTCAVGGVCDHDPLDALCEAGERCSLTQGCATGCTNDADCNDGVFCNGTEVCLRAECYAGMPADCDDGNACTIDTCDTVADGCSRELAPGCDAGAPMIDAGMPCDPFDPAMHYTGSFRVLPAQASSCGMATFNVDGVTISVSGGTLTMQADRFPLAESPAPTGADFHVRYTQSGCATYELEGTFECADRFNARWRATMLDGTMCGTICSDQDTSVVGIRR